MTTSSAQRCTSRSSKLVCEYNDEGLLIATIHHSNLITWLESRGVLGPSWREDLQRVHTSLISPALLLGPGAFPPAEELFPSLLDDGGIENELREMVSAVRAYHQESRSMSEEQPPPVSPPLPVELNAWTLSRLLPALSSHPALESNDERIILLTRALSKLKETPSLALAWSCLLLSRIVLFIRIVRTRENNLRKTKASLLRRRNELSVLIRQKETLLRTRCMDPLVQLPPSIYDVLIRAARKCCQHVERGEPMNKHEDNIEKEEKTVKSETKKKKKKKEKKKKEKNDREEGKAIGESMTNWLAKNQQHAEEQSGGDNNMEEEDDDDDDVAIHKFPRELVRSTIVKALADQVSPRPGSPFSLWCQQISSTLQTPALQKQLVRWRRLRIRCKQKKRDGRKVMDRVINELKLEGQGRAREEEEIRATELESLAMGIGCRQFSSPSSSSSSSFSSSSSSSSSGSARILQTIVCDKRREALLLDLVEFLSFLEGVDGANVSERRQSRDEVLAGRQAAMQLASLVSSQRLLLLLSIYKSSMSFHPSSSSSSSSSSCSFSSSSTSSSSPSALCERLVSSLISSTLTLTSLYHLQSLTLGCLTDTKEHLARTSTRRSHLVRWGTHVVRTIEQFFQARWITFDTETRHILLSSSFFSGSFPSGGRLLSLLVGPWTWAWNILQRRWYG